MRLLLSMMCLAIASAGFAQSNNVVSAYNYLRYYKSGEKASDILEGRELIDKAAVHEKTMNEAKTWVYRGNIYLAMGEAKDTTVSNAAPNALIEAYDSYIRAASLDEKEQYSRDINNGLARLSGLFLSRGVDHFNNANYSKALTLFEKSVDVNKRFNRIDTVGMYNAGLSAERANQPDKAIEYYNACIKANYGGADLYGFIAELYRNKQDTAMAIATVKEGRKAFPADRNLIIEELNFYLLEGKNHEAVENLNLAIKADPENHVLYSSLGVVYDNLSASTKDATLAADYLSKSEEAYKKALEVKPDYIDALFNLGALHINQGVKLMEVANTITDNAKYQKEVAKADQHFKVAMPYLEQALELNPEDPAMMKNILQSLKQLYARMGMTEKFNEVNQRLKN